MKILIDADGCPVIRQTLEIADINGIECVIMSDTSHSFEKYNAKIITVSKGVDSVDFALVNLINEGDIVVTQDYGLAAMCLARKAAVINQNGVQYTNENIDSMLLARHTAKKIRRAGGRLKGSSKRRPRDDEDFIDGLEEIIQNV